MRLQEYGFLFPGTAFISQSLSLNPRTESCTRLSLYSNMAGKLQYCYASIATNGDVIFGSLYKSGCVE